MTWHGGNSLLFFKQRVHIDDTIGYGVIATKIFKQGDFICEYRGELISKEEGERRYREYPPEAGSFMFQLESKANDYQWWALQYVYIYPITNELMQTKLLNTCTNLIGSMRHTLNQFQDTLIIQGLIPTPNHSLKGLTENQKFFLWLQRTFLKANRFFTIMATKTEIFLFYKSLELK